MALYSALIFDLDGTLIDSAPDIAAALNVGFARNGWPQLGPDDVARFLGNGPRRLIIDVLKERQIPFSDAEVNAAYEMYMEAYMAAPAERTQFFDHVYEDLVALKAAGIRCGICTNKAHSVTARVLERLGLADLFEFALGADAVPASKPDPEHLLAVARAMDLEPNSWAYVGDTEVDRATAEAAGVPFYAVPWGGGTKLEVPPAFRLKQLADFLHLEPVATPAG